MYVLLIFFFFSSRRRHTRCALVTGVQTCALPICRAAPRQGPRGDADADGRLGHLTASVADISPAQHLDRAGRPRLAYRHVAGAGPTIVFLPGYMSDMEGGKATAL